MEQNEDKVSRFSPRFSLIKQDDTIEMCILCAVVHYKVLANEDGEYIATIRNGGVDAFAVSQYLFDRGILIDTKTIMETLFNLYLKNIVRQLKNEITREIFYQATEPAVESIVKEIVGQKYIINVNDFKEVESDDDERQKNGKNRRIHDNESAGSSNRNRKQNHQSSDKL